MESIVASEKSLKEIILAGYSQLDANKAASTLQNLVNSELTPRDIGLIPMINIWKFISRLETYVLYDIFESGELIAQSDEVDVKRERLNGAFVFTSHRRATIRHLCGWLQEFDLNASIEKDSLDELSVSQSSAEDTSTNGSGSESYENDTDNDAEDEEKDDNNPSTFFVEREKSTILDKAESSVVDEDTNNTLSLLTSLLHYCSPERTAAILLWHGYINQSIDILMSMVAQDSQTTVQCIEIDQPIDNEYLELIELLATCLTGYKPQENTANSSNSVWKMVCENLCSRLKRSRRKAANYLLASCQFLLANTLSTSSYITYGEILDNNNISLIDRLAFAASYLNLSSFAEWRTSALRMSFVHGSLEGLCLTGIFQSASVRLLQQYLSVTSDLPTVALLASRCLYNTLNITEEETRNIRQQAAWWVQQYREQMNEWGMFVQRGRFDLDLARRVVRYKNESDSIDNNNSDSANQQPQQQPLVVALQQHLIAILTDNPRGVAEPLSPSFTSGVANSSQVKALVEAFQRQHGQAQQLRMHCAYCREALLSGGPNCAQARHDARYHDLRQQLGTVGYCLNNNINSNRVCGKALPACNVCQLPLGMTNRQVNEQFHFAVSKPSAVTITEEKTIQEVDRNEVKTAAASNTKSEEFAVLVCQQCLHGGHPSCLRAWFQKENTCLSSGCNCQCSIGK